MSAESASGQRRRRKHRHLKKKKTKKGRCILGCGLGAAAVIESFPARSRPVKNPVEARRSPWRSWFVGKEKNRGGKGAAVGTKGWGEGAF